MRLMGNFILLFVSGLLFQLCTCQSWVEEIDLLNIDGSVVGLPGYPRAFVPRSRTTDDDKSMIWRLPPRGRNTVNDTDAMCMPAQAQADQTPSYPVLAASPNSKISLKYPENGHATCPGRYPGKNSSGLVFTYGTSQPLPNDTFLSIHGQWNFNGNGGDGRGKLLSKQNFDDGKCYMLDSSTTFECTRIGRRLQYSPTIYNRPCSDDIVLPGDIFPGTVYTLYWVWDYSYSNGAPEIFTSCIDILIEA